MDALISIGAGISFIYSVYLLIFNKGEMYFFESAGMIFTLITLGKALEANSKAHTMDAINALSQLVPDTVRILKGNDELTVKENELKPLDIVIIRKGDNVPVDGKVVKGKGLIDKSALTGESLPMEVCEGNEIISGSVCLDGFLYIEALKTGKDTTLSHIIEMVREATLKKTPIERLADRISGVFVPIVLSISLITFIIWMLTGADFDFALKMSISVIVISCPCALGLATPTAVMAGTGNAATHGILIRSAECLETARNVTTVLLDKTGTVTEGELTVTDIYEASDTSKENLLLMAAVLEASSNHPYANAIRNEALDYYNPKRIMEHNLESVENIDGRGIKGIIDGGVYYAGNALLMEENGISILPLKEKYEELSRQGKTVLFFGDDRLRGIIAIADKVRDDSKEAINKLKKQGLKVFLVTGDNKETAEAISKEVGIENIISEVLPEDKGNVVDKIKATGEKVAMVGDGINDAAALVKADIGIAIGNGTKIAIDSADFILINNKLSDVSYLFKLSRRTLKIIKENLFWALFYNCLGIPLAAGVLFVPFGISLTPVISAACMSVSSLFVVLNALRLRK